ncbi:MAG: hypothetical protein GWN01_14955, partial [Nitrosopumilaceae archaeon]|nr:hypothetical protein [Nitrosopumilaceae archaeon]NIU88537.1 hypothetical protein [Nitrosopumilaceae archaeon]NIV66771.1 hypothetical protein [Nitrosopumilaceae archaeon]NIX62749.1 hypothetical protein [Nitrosopumilaceae archaeon]
MLKNIIIHPGMPKTGTSALQSRLQQNRRALAKKGVFYPVTISPLENLYWTLESHHLLFYSLAGYGESSAFSPQRFMEWVEEVCEFYDINTMILSAENIWWLPFLVFKEENLKEDEYWERKEEFFQKISCLFNKFNTQILIYLRRQDYWFESW